MSVLPECSYVHGGICVNNTLNVYKHRAVVSSAKFTTAVVYLVEYQIYHSVPVLWNGPSKLNSCLIVSTRTLDLHDCTVFVQLNVNATTCWSRQYTCTRAPWLHCTGNEHTHSESDSTPCTCTRTQRSCPACLVTGSLHSVVTSTWPTCLNATSEVYTTLLLLPSLTKGAWCGPYISMHSYHHRQLTVRLTVEIPTDSPAAGPAWGVDLCPLHVE